MRNHSTITIFLVLLLGLLTTVPAFSQSNTSVNKELNKSAIYGELALARRQNETGLSLSASLKYDYIFLQGLIFRNISSFISIGIITREIEESHSQSSLNFQSQLGLIISFRSHHIEFSGGIQTIPREFTYSGNNTIGIVKLGYRYQSPKRPIIVKLNIGSPEVISLGIGLSF